MISALIFLAAVLLSGVQADQGITDGEIASQDEFSFMASLRNNTSHICSGYIVHPRWIVSAAHCLLYGIITKAGVGNVFLLNQTIYEIENAIPHSNFNHQLQLNDIMMVKIRKEITLIPGLVSIAFVNLLFATDFEAKETRLVTWGKMSVVTDQDSRSLLVSNYKVQSPSRCYYASIHSEPRTTLFSSETQVCAVANNDIPECHVDGGAILVKNGMVHGIATKRMTVSCTSDSPVVFTRTSYFYDWAIFIANNN